MRQISCGNKWALYISLILCIISIYGCIPRLPEKYSTSEPIDVSNDILNEFTGKHREALIRHLKSSANWIVQVKSPGVVSAIRRQREDGVLQDVLNGMYLLDLGTENFLSTFIRICFDSSKPTTIGEVPNTPAVAGGSLVKLTLTDPLPDYGSPGYSSHLTIQGENLLLDIYEQFAKKERKFTRESLAMIYKEFKEVLENEQEVFDKGYIKDITPEKSVIQSERSQIDIKTESGSCQIFAYVNPGESGYVYAKVFDLETNTQLKLNIPKCSIEFVGWSSNPKDKFFYNREIHVHKGSDMDSYHPARFELWFHPDRGGVDRKLLETEGKVSGWRR